MYYSTTNPLTINTEKILNVEEKDLSKVYFFLNVQERRSRSRPVSPCQSTTNHLTSQQNQSRAEPSQAQATTATTTAAAAAAGG